MENQNSELKILVIDNLTTNTSRVPEQLDAEGYQSVEVKDFNSLLSTSLDAIDAELMIIDTLEADQLTLATIEIIVQSRPSAVLLMSHGSVHRSSIETAIQAGISTYIGRSDQITLLRPLIDNALLQFSSMQRLRQELQQTQSRLADRKQIERAKGLLMKKHQCDEEQAYSALRKLSMNRAQNMGEVARELLGVLE